VALRDRATVAREHDHHHVLRLEVGERVLPAVGAVEVRPRRGRVADAEGLVELARRGRRGQCEEAGERGSESHQSHAVIPFGVPPRWGCNTFSSRYPGRTSLLKTREAVGWKRV